MQEETDTCQTAQTAQTAIQIPTELEIIPDTECCKKIKLVLFIIFVLLIVAIIIFASLNH